MRIGVIGDTHLKAVRPGYLEFCSDMFQKNRVDTIVHIGDLVDWHAVSFHAKQPELPGMADEYHMAYEAVQRWQETFPVVKWCIGNHDERPARKTRDAGMAEFVLRPYNELWGLEKWEMDFEFILDGTKFVHGTGTSGIHPAWTLMNKSKMNIVMGHCHSRAGTKWSMNPERRFFCMDVGCGINEREYQFAYGRHMPERPILACGLVLDGQPISVAMKCGKGEKYHDSNFVDPNKPRTVFLGKHLTYQKTDEKIAKAPVHYVPFKSLTAACNVKGNYGAATVKGDVTCGNCKRTAAFLEE